MKKIHHWKYSWISRDIVKIKKKATLNDRFEIEKYFSELQPEFIDRDIENLIRRENEKNRFEEIH